MLEANAVTVAVAPVEVRDWTPTVGALLRIPAPTDPSTYDLTASCVGTAESLAKSPPRVLSAENSLIATPNSAPKVPRRSEARPARLNALASRVAVPVACSTVKNSPTLKLPSWSEET